VKFADLHIHSNFSDSSYSLKEILEKAKEKNLSCISVVDHDSLDAYYSGELFRLSREYSLELIMGLELSSQYRDEEIHLLGYFRDNKVDLNFLKILKSLKEDRLRRILKMIDILNSLGIKLDKTEFKEFVGSSSASRLHLAIFLKEKGIVKDIGEAFSKYIGVGRPAYISRFRYSLEEAIRFLKKEGALVFLAHPLTLREQKNLEDFIRLGLDGIEVFYPNYSEETRANYQRLASKYSLLISGGSDSHGEYKERTEIGSVKISYSYVEKIKNAF